MSSAILVIDDDHDYRRSLVRHLRLLKHIVAEASSSVEALELLKRRDFDLVLMEIALGAAGILDETSDRRGPFGGEGFDLLEIIRSFSHYIPVIVLSNLSRTEDELASIRSGADSFLRKPLEMNLLTAYVRASLSRKQMMRAGRSSPRELNPSLSAQTGTLIHAGGLLIDKKSRLVQIGAGTYHQLSEKEIQLLSLMATHPGKLFSKNELIDQVWGRSDDCGHHAVDSTIKRLRKKIEPRPQKPRFLITSRGLGYRFVAADPELLLYADPAVHALDDSAVK